MLKTIKEMMGGTLNLFLFIAIWTLPLIFLMGADWTSKYLLEPLMTTGWTLLAINVAILLPLSIFKKFRPVVGKGIFYTSFIFGFIAWYLSFIYSYLIWGEWGAVSGILLLGVGVVPVALLATGINSHWEPFFTLLIMTALIFVARSIGKRIENPEKTGINDPFNINSEYENN